MVSQSLIFCVLIYESLRYSKIRFLMFLFGKKHQVPSFSYVVLKLKDKDNWKNCIEAHKKACTVQKPCVAQAPSSSR